MNAYYWFGSHTTRPDYKGPKQGALVLADGSTVALDFTCYADMAKVGANPSVGLALLLPANGEWLVEVKATGTLAGASFRGSAPDLAAAVSLAFGELRGAQQEEDWVRANPELHLERELAHHDWWSHMSDDHGVWSSGEAHGRLLATLAAQVSPETARFLWAKYAPAGFNCPV